nr:MAG TPA: hypothetical protein [Caudoviricetes sp.]DAY67807.1 MAG TPA: hypothetical protein [Caudoviricetes sp.]
MIKHQLNPIHRISSLCLFLDLHRKFECPKWCLIKSCI